jgi:general secretion pathway protein G
MIVFHEKSKLKNGFTLLELLIVIAVMSLLMAIVTPQVIGMFSGAKTDSAALQMESITTSLNYYKLDAGRYPLTEQGLDVLWKEPANVKGWNGPYIRKKQHLLDPWGVRFHYRFPGEHGVIDIFSYGADNKQGGKGENADVVNWEA